MILRCVVSCSLPCDALCGRDFLTIPLCPHSVCPFFLPQFASTEFAHVLQAWTCQTGRPGDEEPHYYIAMETCDFNLEEFVNGARELTRRFPGCLRDRSSASRSRSRSRDRAPPVSAPATRREYA